MGAFLTLIAKTQVINENGGKSTYARDPGSKVIGPPADVYTTGTDVFWKEGVISAPALIELASR